MTRRGFARASTTTGAPRVLDVLIWYPAAPSARPADEQLAGVVDAVPSRAGAPYPVVVFSTGAGGLPTSIRYLTPHLASHGFVVAVTTHPGTTPPPCPFAPCVPPRTPEAAEWIAESLANRPDDIRFLGDELLRLGRGGDALLDGLLDDGRMAMTGYSGGGRTTLAVLAENPGFRAGVAMASAGGDLAEVREAAAQVAVPMMLLSGERDHLATIDRQQGLFEALTRAPERWWVVFPRGGHGQFPNSCPAAWAACGPEDLSQAEAHALIRRWVTPFLLRYVAGDHRYAPLLDPVSAADNPETRVVVVSAP